MMKKMYLIFAAVCLIFALTACTKQTSETTAPETTTTAAETTAAETTKETNEETTTEENESKEETEKLEETGEETTEETTTEDELQSVTGQVIGIDKSIITISGQNNLEYQVDIKNAETRSDLEIGEGDVIQVLFLEQEEEIKAVKSYDILTSVALEGDTDPIVAGIIQQVDAGTVTIEAASGKTYRFSTAIAQIVKGEKGLVVGEYVEITYLGNLSDGKALRVITEDGSGDAEATYKVLSGKLISADASALILEAADGSRFSFALGELIDLEELETGGEIELSYEGSLTKQNAVATDIEF